MSVSTPSPPRKVAILRDRLFVSGDWVTEAILDQFKSELAVGSQPVTNPDTGEVEQVPIFETFNHYQVQWQNSDQSMYSFNRGDMAKIRRVFHDFEIIDERMTEPMQAKLKIKFPDGLSWREYQPDAINFISSNEHGLLKAPPRSGKTLMIAACICLERQKTIVFAHQTDLLTQLYDTFLTFTNLAEIQRPGSPVVGFANTIEDFDRLDVALCTKQMFDHATNKDTMRIVQKLFGSVWVDEVHFVGADIYSSLINRFHAKNRRGVTATPKRKDGKDVIVDNVIGPTVYTITAEQVQQVPMEVERVNTDLKLQVRDFTKILKLLYTNEGRNKLIVKRMVEDVANGHSLIAVTDRREHQDILKRMLGEHGISVELFNGKTNNKDLRKKILNKVRSKETKVLIAMRGMTTGLDIPCADVFYNLLPSSNAVADGEFAGEGGYEQQCTRVRTPFEGKSICYVRDFVDDFGISYACWNERQKTYLKIGARILRFQEKQKGLELRGFMDMDDGLGGVG